MFFHQNTTELGVSSQSSIGYFVLSKGFRVSSIFNIFHPVICQIWQTCYVPYFVCCVIYNSFSRFCGSNPGILSYGKHIHFCNSPTTNIVSIKLSLWEIPYDKSQYLTEALIWPIRETSGCELYLWGSSQPELPRRMVMKSMYDLNLRPTETGLAQW